MAVYTGRVCSHDITVLICHSYCAAETDDYY